MLNPTHIYIELGQEVKKCLTLTHTNTQRDWQVSTPPRAAYWLGIAPAVTKETLIDRERGTEGRGQAREVSRREWRKLKESQMEGYWQRKTKKGGGFERHRKERICSRTERRSQTRCLVQQCVFDQQKTGDHQIKYSSFIHKTHTFKHILSF